MIKKVKTQIKTPKQISGSTENNGHAIIPRLVPNISLCDGESDSFQGHVISEGNVLASNSLSNKHEFREIDLDRLNEYGSEIVSPVIHRRSSRQNLLSRLNKHNNCLETEKATNDHLRKNEVVEENLENNGPYENITKDDKIDAEIGIKNSVSEKASKEVFVFEGSHNELCPAEHTHNAIGKCELNDIIATDDKLRKNVKSDGKIAKLVSFFTTSKQNKKSEKELKAKQKTPKHKKLVSENRLAWAETPTVPELLKVSSPFVLYNLARRSAITPAKPNKTQDLCQPVEATTPFQKRQKKKLFTPNKIRPCADDTLTHSVRKPKVTPKCTPKSILINKVLDKNGEVLDYL